LFVVAFFQTLSVVFAPSLLISQPGINKEGFVERCRECLKYNRGGGSQNSSSGGGWTTCEDESKELMALCLKRMPLPSGTKLVDAGWIWTEPHSKRLKLKLKVQADVLTGFRLEQGLIVQFVVQNKQCTDCAHKYTDNTWRTVVQVRQHVDHKRTMLHLEQLLLKSGMYNYAVKIQEEKGGLDFFFAKRAQATMFLNFLDACMPNNNNKRKDSQKLISHNERSGTANLKHAYSVEICPLCKNDLVLLPKKLAQQLRGISRLVLVTKVSSSIHLVDPFSGQVAELSSEKYWRYPCQPLLTSRNMTEMTVLDIDELEDTRTPVAAKSDEDAPLLPAPAPASSTIGVNSAPQEAHFAAKEAKKAQQKTKRMARFEDLPCVHTEVVRNSDFGVNDITHHTRTHLGHIVRAGDVVRGYDLLTACNGADDHDEDANPLLHVDVEMVIVQVDFGARQEMDGKRKPPKKKQSRRRLRVEKQKEVVSDAPEDGGKKGKKPGSKHSKHLKSKTGKKGSKTEKSFETEEGVLTTAAAAIKITHPTCRHRSAAIVSPSLSVVCFLIHLPSFLPSLPPWDSFLHCFRVFRSFRTTF
jgi:nonsense-mediated mRNA decay protein 3